MAKRGRTPTHPSEVQQHQTIEINSQHLYRISTIERVMVFDMVTGAEVTGYMLSTYNGQVKFFFTNSDEVMIVDESTLTQLPFD